MSPVNIVNEPLQLEIPDLISIIMEIALEQLPQEAQDSARRELAAIDNVLKTTLLPLIKNISLKGLTPLMYASTGIGEDVVKFLLDNKANPNQRVAQKGFAYNFTPIMIALLQKKTSGEEENPELEKTIKLLKKRGKKIKRKDRQLIENTIQKIQEIFKKLPPEIRQFLPKLA